jgi:hypothetical protein
MSLLKKNQSSEMDLNCGFVKALIADETDGAQMSADERRNNLIFLFTTRRGSYVFNK